MPKPTQKKFIVKVQLSLFDSRGENRLALVYTKERDISYETEATPEIVKRVANAPKAFLYATLDADGTLRLGELAPWQDW